MLLVQTRSHPPMEWILKLTGEPENCWLRLHLNCLHSFYNEQYCFTTIIHRKEARLTIKQEDHRVLSALKPLGYTPRRAYQQTEVGTVGCSATVMLPYTQLEATVTC